MRGISSGAGGMNCRPWRVNHEWTLTGNPPARTRRIVGNVELVGQRGDELSPAEQGYTIEKREVIMDYANIEVPTLGLLF